MLRVGDGTLTSGDVERVARGEARVVLAPDVLDRVGRWAVRAAEYAGNRPIYGRSTGVGANRGVPVTPDAGHALRLLRSHATSAGPLRSPERVRAMLLVRLAQLAAGGNGIDPAVVQALVALLDADALPPVREWVGIGTGDLSALATTALVLTGEVPASRPVPMTVTFGPGDALAFLSSNAAALGDAALAVAALRRLAAASLVTGSLTLAAVRGNREAFAPAVAVATPFPGAATVCRTVRTLTDPSRDPGPRGADEPARPQGAESREVAGPRDDPRGVGGPARIQDPFGLRTMPQVHGALLDALDRAEAVVTAMATAPSENPALSPEHGVAHHGAFHAAYLGQALDALRLAVAEAATTTLSRVTMLAEPELTGDEPFLADGTPGASGTMVVEYVAAAVVGDLRASADPAGRHTVTVSRGLEDGASQASLAARETLGVVEPLRVLLGCELLTAARALGPLGPAATLPPALEPVLDAVAEAVPRLGDRADRDLTTDLEEAVRLVDGLPALAGASLG